MGTRRGVSGRHRGSVGCAAKLGGPIGSMPPARPRPAAAGPGAPPGARGDGRARRGVRAGHSRSVRAGLADRDDGLPLVPGLHL